MRIAHMRDAEPRRCADRSEIRRPRTSRGDHGPEAHRAGGTGRGRSGDSPRVSDGRAAERSVRRSDHYRRSRPGNRCAPECRSVTRVRCAPQGVLAHSGALQHSGSRAPELPIYARRPSPANSRRRLRTFGTADCRRSWTRRGGVSPADIWTPGVLPTMGRWRERKNELPDLQPSDERTALVQRLDHYRAIATAHSSTLTGRWPRRACCPRRI